MAVKYTIPFKSVFEKDNRIDISSELYTGDPIPLKGVGGQVFLLNYNGQVGEPHSRIISSSASISVYQTTGMEIDITELQEAPDRTFRVQYFEEGEIRWSGYITPDGIQQAFQAPPYILNITATDGLMLLEDMPAGVPNSTSLFTPIAGVANRAPINFIRLALLWRLGINLPIQVTVNSIENTYFEGENVLAGSMTWAAHGQGIQDASGNMKSLLWVVENIVTSVNGRLYQANGRWVIERIPDVITGVYSSKLLTGNIIEDIEINNFETIGESYPFLKEDAITTVLPALGSSEVEYNQDIRENVVPNGGIDQLIGGAPLYWGHTPTEGWVILTYEDPINGRTGNSLSAEYIQDSLPDHMCYLTVFNQGEEGIPFDANLLYKRFTLGFTFMPVLGFPVLENGDIDWGHHDFLFGEWPLQISVMYTVPVEEGIRNYYLNEFGYWQYESRGQGVGVNYSYTHNNWPPGGNQRTIWVYFTGSPNIGDVIRIGVRINPGSSIYYFYYFEVTAAEEGNLAAALQGMVNNLPNDVNGWNLVNKQVIMSDAVNGCIRWSMYAPLSLPMVDTYKSGLLQDFHNINLKIDNLRLGDVANIQFQSNGGSSDIIIPDPGMLGPNTNKEAGRLYFRIKIIEKQKFVIDDVRISVEDNNNIYKAEYNSNGALEKTQMGISSQWSGISDNNYMTGWAKSSEEAFYTDGIVTGDLTELLARSIMRFRYKSCTMFSGTINTRYNNWFFGKIYDIFGLGEKKFLNLSASYNSETEECNIGIVECRNDNIPLSLKHYGSNDKQLSN